MAARLPTRDDLGGMPSARTGRPIARADGSAVGQGMQGYGQGAANLGKTVTAIGADIYERQQKAEEYETLKKMVEFQRSTEQDFEAYKREIAPGGDGFKEGWDQRYHAKAYEFFGKDGANFPERVRQKVDLGLLQHGEKFSTNAQRYQFAERDRYHVADLEEQHAGWKRDVEANPAMLADRLALARAQVENAPIEGRLKPTLLKRYPRELDKTARDALVLGIGTVEDAKKATDMLFVNEPISPEKRQKGDAGQLFKRGGSTIKSRDDGLATITASTGAEFHVAKDHAERFKGAIDDLLEAGLEIKGDQSGGFADRNIRGTNTPSQHKFGRAIDINWSENARGTKGKIDPELARSVAQKWGLTWGGDWSNPDPMHFEVAKDAGPLPSVPVASRGITSYAGLSKSKTDDGTGARLPTKADLEDESRAWGSVNKDGKSKLGAEPGAPRLIWASEEAGEAKYVGPFQGASLSERVTTYKQVQARLKQLAAPIEAEIKSYEANAAEGVLPPEAHLAELTEKVERLGDPQTKAYFNSVMGNAALTAQLNPLRPVEHEAVLRSERAKLMDKDGILRATPEGRKRLAHMEQLLKSKKEQVNSDPLGWAERVGLEQPEPVNWDDDASMQRHAEKARRVGQYLNQAPQFFSPIQRDALKDIVRVGGEKMAGTLGRIVKNFGADAPLALAEFAKEEPQAAWVGGMWLDGQITRGANRQAIADAAKGIEMYRDKNFHKVIERNDSYRTAVTETLGTAFQANSANYAGALATADAIAEARFVQKGITKFDSTAVEVWQQALKEALGEHVADGKTYGGLAYQRTGLSWALGTGKQNPILIPPNVRKDTFEQLINTIRHEDLIGDFGEGPMTGERASASGARVGGNLLSMQALRKATLVSVDNGRYRMALGDPQSADTQWIKNQWGQDYVLDINALEPKLKQRRPDLYLGGDKPASGMMRLGGPGPFDAGVKSPVEKTLFAGERAATADKGALTEARELDRAGEKPSTVWETTGWFKGNDGKWRSEIDDSAAKVVVDPKELEAGKAYTLKDVIDHDDLFKAYPAFAGMKVHVYEGSPTGPGGAYHFQSGALQINKNAASDKKALRDTLIHEIQHGLTSTEGFAYLGNPISALLGNGYDIPGEVEARDAVNRGYESPEWRRKNSPASRPTDTVNPRRDRK